MTLPLLPAFAEDADASWPHSRQEDQGMLWFWGNRNHTGTVVDAEDNWVRDGEGIPRRGARHAWFGGIEPHDGFLEAADTGPALAQALETGRQFHVEMALHPPMDGQAAGTLFWLGTFELESLWFVGIENGRLMLVRPGKDNGEERLDIMPLAPNAPLHLGLSFTENSVEVWVNGKRESKLEADILPEIEDPWDLIAGFGGGDPELAGWRGSMENLALYYVAPSFEVSATAWRKAMDARTPPEWIRIEAELVTEGTAPDAEQMTDYGQALLGRIWKPVNPEAAPEALREGFFTWQWLYLDNRFLDTAQSLTPGDRVNLIIGRADTQPQLNDVQQIIQGLDPLDFIQMEEYFIQDAAPVSGEMQNERTTP
ncbi:MAG: hypothetical protein JJU29_15710 [Verrucomicrobia bacterium]|nr:hypothetical protein [Verrucomicrobiota bacterium]MCH8513468.1 hypothetical protein [Kiritimatiellia bacterium]